VVYCGPGNNGKDFKNYSFTTLYNGRGIHLCAAAKQISQTYLESIHPDNRTEELTLITTPTGRKNYYQQASISQTFFLETPFS